MSRRTVLKIAGAVAGAGAVGGATLGYALDPNRPAIFGLFGTPAPDPVWHVLNRAAYGPRPGQVEAVRKLGAQTYLQRQLDPAAIDDAACERRLSAYPTLAMTVAQMYATQTDDSSPLDELDAATLLRAVYSERQLFEIVVQFWSEHFSIWHGKDLCPYLKTGDDRDVIRPHAFGSFRALLGASAHSPAMLNYLDNAGSVADHPNENYARELMELHTLGVGNYSEADVKNVARCFTGWTIKPDDDPDADSFIFDPTIHDDGDKAVLGQHIPAGGGQADGERVLDLLAAHPATARHICTKLCRRFVGDDPPPGVVSATMQAFNHGAGTTRDVLRALFASDDFWHAPPKFKRPYEYLVALLRALDVPLSHGSALNVLYTLQTLSHRPFDHVTPEGYSDRGPYWMADLLVRWNAAIAIVYGQLADDGFDPLAVARNAGARSARQVLDYFAAHLLGRPFAPPEVRAFMAFAHELGGVDLTSDSGKALLTDAISLVAAAPAAQWR